MRAATEGHLPPVMPQGNLVEVLGREVRKGSPGELMVESSPSRQRRPPCKTSKEMSDVAADAAALTYLTYCSVQSTKQKHSDWARSYHHEVTQRVQAGIDQTRLAQCELWIQFGMPMWVEDEHVGYTRLDVSAAAEEPSQHAHAEGGDKDVDEPGDDDDEPLLTGSDRRSPQISTQVRASRLARQMRTSRGRARRQSRKSQRPRRQLSRSRRH